MKESSVLTRADKAAIERIPDGWFNALNLSYMVRAKEFRCGRLEKMGILESRIVGEYPKLSREYRKKCGKRRENHGKERNQEI